MQFLTVTAAVAPSLLILVYFIRRDRFPEPTWMILATFGLGIAILAPVLPLALLLQLPFDSLENLHARAFGQAFFGAAIPEELLKFAVLYWFCRPRAAFDEPMDGLVYGVTVSLGFAMLENILYAMEGGLAIALMRAVTAVPMHACAGAIMGFFFGLAHFLPHRRRWFLSLALLLPVVFHGGYNFPLFALVGLEAEGGIAAHPGLAALLILTVLAVFAGGVLLAFRLHRRLVRTQTRRLRGIRTA